jgi:hypothetical protein
MIILSQNYEVNKYKEDGNKSIAAPAAKQTPYEHLAHVVSLCMCRIPQLPGQSALTDGHSAAKPSSRYARVKKEGEKIQTNHSA